MQITFTIYYLFQSKFKCFALFLKKIPKQFLWKILTIMLIKPNSVVVVHDKVMHEQLKGKHKAWTQNIPCITKTYNGYQLQHKYY